VQKFQDMQTIPAVSEYFEACRAGAEEAGLKFLGRATIDSTRNELRRNSVVRGTSVPTTLFERHTTLVFSLPRYAFLMAARYVERQKPDHSKVHEGKVVSTDEHPYWVLNLIVGVRSGMWWGDDNNWLFIDTQFNVDRLQVATRRYIGNTCYISARPFNVKLNEYDADYEVVLGCWPQRVPPALFYSAMTNLVGVVRPYIREGLLGHADTSDFPPWQDFRNCEKDFWSQLSIKNLQELFISPP
jgi:hypothetical protein